MGESAVSGVNPGKYIAVTYVIVVAVILFLLFKFLHKINIFGTSEATKEAEKLGTDISLSEDTTNALNEVDNKFRAAVKEAVLKKYGSKATVAQLKSFTASLLPNIANYPTYLHDIWKAYNRLSENDPSKIVGVIKSLKSQFEVNAFALFYKVESQAPAQKPFLPKESLAGDFYEALNNLMHDSDMQKLRATINAKPLI